jgi:hypothetical protein
LSTDSNAYDLEVRRFFRDVFVEKDENIEHWRQNLPSYSLDKRKATPSSRKTEKC